MTLHTPHHVTRGATPAHGADAPATPVGTSADRRAFVRDWIASRQKGVTLMLGGLALAPLMLAAGGVQAQIAGDSLVRADSIQGVQSVAVNPDGSASLTLTNGQVVNVAAAQVTVLADGTIAISVAAAAEVASAVAAAGLAGGAGAGVAAIGGAVGLAGALGGGGGASEPDVTVALASGRSTLNAAELNVGATFVGRTTPGTEVRVTFDDTTLTTTADEDGNWSVTFDDNLPAPGGDNDGPYGVSVAVFELDEDDEPGDEPLFTTGITITIDTVPPTIEITGTLSGAVESELSTDNIINLAESSQPLTVFGTTDGAEDGQIVTVTLSGDGFEAEATGPVSGNAWTATFTADQLEGLPDNATLTLVAEVTDVALNPGESPEFEITTDLTAPEVEINPVTGNDILTLANRGNPVEVTGFTDAEPGTEIVLTFNGEPLEAAPVIEGGGSGALPNSWTGTIPGDLTNLLVDLPDVQDLFPLTAQATDAAGNPSEVVTVNLETNFTLPSIAINPVAADIGFPDSVNEEQSSGDLVITGTTGNVPDEAVVTVQILQDGTDVATGTGEVSGGTWTVTFTGPIDGLLDDGVTYTVTADVEGEVDGDTIAADQATRSFSTDFTPPTVTITTPVAVDNVINIDEAAEGFDVTGSTDPSEAGRDVIVRVDGTQVGSAVVQTGGGWTVPVDLSDLSLSGGETVSFTASVTDAAGNTGTSAAAPATVDFSEPNITVNDPAGDTPATALNADDAASLTITGTSDVQPLTVEVREVGGPAVFTASSVVFDGDNWTATFTQPNPLAHDTLYIVEASGETTAGNPGSATSEQFLTDFVEPAVNITRITDDFLDNVINESDVEDGFTVTGTSDEIGATVSVTLTGVAGGPFTETVDGDGNWTVSIPGGLALTDGTSPEFVVSISDPAGNTGTATESATVNFTAPEITITGIGDDAFINIAERDDDGITVTGTATGADGQTVTVTLTDGTVTLTATGTVESGAWEANFLPGDDSGQLGTLSQGAVTVNASVQNTIGNTGTATPFDATADFTRPTITIAEPGFLVTDGEVSFLNEAAAGLQTISGTATGAEGQPVTVTVNGTELTPVDPVIVDGDGDWSGVFDLSGLAEGPATITATVSNEAGNEVAAPATLEFTVDTEAPVLVITDIQSGGETVEDFINAAIRDAGITVTGTTDDPADVTVTVASGSFTAEVTVTPDGGTWTAVFEGDSSSYDLEDLPEGPVTITATSTDAANNTGTSDAENFTADFTPPTITVDSHALDGLIVGSSTGLEENATVNLTVNGEPYEATVDADGIWQFQLEKGTGANSWVQSGLAYNQPFTVVANAEDAAGNLSGDVSQQVLLYLAGGVIVASIDQDDDTFDVAVFLDTPGPNAPDTGIGIDVQVLTDPSVAVGTILIAVSEVFTFVSNGTIAFNAATPGQVIVSAASPETPEDGEPLFVFGMNLPDGEQLVRLEMNLTNPQGNGGNSETWIGTAGNDTITVGAIDSVVQGGGGNDTIDLTASGRNTVIFEADPADNGVDTILGFEVGVDAPRPDRIAFVDPESVDVRGDALEILDAPETIGVTTGFVVLTEALGNLGAALTSAAGDFGAADDDVFYLLATDGDDSVLAQVVISGGNATATVMATFEELGDLSGVTDDTILGFSSV